MTDAIKRRLAGMTENDRIAIRDASERGGRYYPGWMTCAGLSYTELPRPDMPTIFTSRCLNALGLRARQLLIEDWDEIVELGRDPILEKLQAIAQFVDSGWDAARSTYSPSELMILRYFIAVSDIENVGRIQRMKVQAVAWIEEGRRRWKAGFSADPFGIPKARMT